MSCTDWRSASSSNVAFIFFQFSQDFSQKLARDRGAVGCDLLRRSYRDDVTSGVPAFGAEIDDPVGRLDDVQIMLDDQHGTACLDQTFKSRKQLVDVVKV